MAIKMGYIIKNINELNMADNKVWGNKIAYLSDANRNGIPVPRGFGIAFDKNVFEECKSEFKSNLLSYFSCLKRETGAKCFIVRSSAQGEDRENHVFPGLYKSKKDIKTAEQLLDAVEECYKSFTTDTIKIYKSEMGVKTYPKERLCLLVQEQIQPDYSGVVFTKVPIDSYYDCDSYLVELIRGHCGAMLQGQTRPEASYIINGKSKQLDVKKIWNAERANLDVEKELLYKIRQMTDKLIELYGTELNIEWGYEREQVVILQIRPIQHIKSSRRKVCSLNKYLGLKAEAMKKFSQKGLFPKKLLIIEAGKSFEVIQKEIEKENELQGPLTVRYSCGKELGLPRGFVEDKEAAIAYIKSTYNEKWTIILHESICVRHSYELYLDGEKAILEHVPGMWESDSKVSTDVWIFHGKQVTALAAGYVRNARYEGADTSYYQQVEPFLECNMKKIAKKIYPYIQKIRKDWNLDKGNNLHFVEDEKGIYYFLNYRKIPEISECVTSEKKLTVINTLYDFSKWKGEDILLKIDLKRGQEILLKQVVPLLRESGTKVYVEFGLLSHPAILLREFGIEVLPLYSIHKKYIFTI